MRRLLSILVLTPLLLAAKATPEHAADIARVEAYLTGLTTIVADFNQVDAQGGVAEGKFYLKRPGKMRWEYKPPTPILLVSNGKVITYYDAELDQINYVPVDDTLAGFLAQPRIVLNSGPTKLTDFSAANGILRATVVQANKADEGSLTLEFTDKPLQLAKMVIADASGQRTQIQLQNATFGKALPNTLFTFEDPRGFKPRSQRQRD